MAKYPSEPGIQKYSASASKEIALSSIQRTPPGKRVKEMATEILQESSSLEDLHQERFHQANGVRYAGDFKNNRAVANGQIRTPTSGKRKAGPVSSYPSPTRGMPSMSYKDPLSFSKFASPIGKAPHLPTNMHSFSPSMMPAQARSSLVVLDGTKGSEHMYASSSHPSERKQFIKEERQSLLFETYGVQGIVKESPGMKTQGIKRKQLKTHLVQAADSTWATPVVSPKQLVRDELLAGLSSSQPYSSRSDTGSFSSYGPPNPARNFISGGGMGESGYDEMEITDHQYLHKPQQRTEPSSSTTRALLKKKRLTSTSRETFQIKIESDTQLHISKEIRSPFASPISPSQKRSKGLANATRNPSKVGTRQMQSNIKQSMLKKPVTSEVTAESLTAYAAKLFNEDFGFEDNSRSGVSTGMTNGLSAREKAEIQEKERLSFAEKLHKMIDKAKSSLAVSNVTSEPAVSSRSSKSSSSKTSVHSKTMTRPVVAEIAAPAERKTRTISSGSTKKAAKETSESTLASSSHLSALNQPKVQSHDAKRQVGSKATLSTPKKTWQSTGDLPDTTSADEGYDDYGDFEDDEGSADKGPEAEAGEVSPTTELPGTPRDVAETDSVSAQPDSELPQQHDNVESSTAETPEYPIVIAEYEKSGATAESEIMSSEIADELNNANEASVDGSAASMQDSDALEDNPTNEATSDIAEVVEDSDAAMPSDTAVEHDDDGVSGMDPGTERDEASFESPVAQINEDSVAATVEAESGNALILDIDGSETLEVTQEVESIPASGNDLVSAVDEPESAEPSANDSKQLLPPHDPADTSDSEASGEAVESSSETPIESVSLSEVGPEGETSHAAPESHRPDGFGYQDDAEGEAVSGETVPMAKAEEVPQNDSAVESPEQGGSGPSKEPGTSIEAIVESEALVQPDIVQTEETVDSPETVESTACDIIGDETQAEAEMETPGAIEGDGAVANTNEEEVPSEPSEFGQTETVEVPPVSEVVADVGSEEADLDNATPDTASDATMRTESGVAESQNASEPVQPPDVDLSNESVEDLPRDEPAEDTSSKEAALDSMPTHAVGEATTPFEAETPELNTVEPSGFVETEVVEDPPRLERADGVGSVEAELNSIASDTADGATVPVEPETTESHDAGEPGQPGEVDSDDGKTEPDLSDTNATLESPLSVLDATSPPERDNEASGSQEEPEGVDAAVDSKSPLLPEQENALPEADGDAETNVASQDAPADANEQKELEAVADGNDVPIIETAEHLQDAAADADVDPIYSDADDFEAEPNYVETAPAKELPALQLEEVKSEPQGDHLDAFEAEVDATITQTTSEAPVSPETDDTYDDFEPDTDPLSVQALPAVQASTSAESEPGSESPGFDVYDDFEGDEVSPPLTSRVEDDPPLTAAVKTDSIVASAAQEGVAIVDDECNDETEYNESEDEADAGKPSPSDNPTIQSQESTPREVEDDEESVAPSPTLPVAQSVPQDVVADEEELGDYNDDDYAAEEDFEEDDKPATKQSGAASPVKQEETKPTPVQDGAEADYDAECDDFEE